MIAITFKSMSPLNGASPRHSPIHTPFNISRALIPLSLHFLFCYVAVVRARLLQFSLSLSVPRFHFSHMLFGEHIALLFLCMKLIRTPNSDEVILGSEKKNKRRRRRRWRRGWGAEGDEKRYDETDYYFHCQCRHRCRYQHHTICRRQHYSYVSFHFISHKLEIQCKMVMWFCPPPSASYSSRTIFRFFHSCHQFSVV